MVPSAATIVIVVCVSFLVFMIILGVFRIRAAHQRTMRDQESGKENEMDWDDSALTITVNPMEVKTHIRLLTPAITQFKRSNSVLPVKPRLGFSLDRFQLANG